MTQTPIPHRHALAFGLAAITASTLLLEITLTRVFSVTMWYHFAFMAISLALFGMAMGAVIVYLRPAWFPQERLFHRLAQMGVAFALTAVAAFWIHLQIPFSPRFTLGGMASVVSTFLLVAVPFVVSGVIVSLVLTRFPTIVGRLYAFDLIGAAMGCILLWVLIGPLTGPGVVLASAVLAGIGAFLFARASGQALLTRVSLAVVFALALLTVLQPEHKLFRLQWVKAAEGSLEAPEEPIVERWNSHSVITVYEKMVEPFAWGMSPAWKGGAGPDQLLLKIDAAAGTVITRFDGDLTDVEHLAWDVTALAHHVRPEARTLVIGAGGGRDVLTALRFGSPRVTSVEINRDILDVVNGMMGEFTGHLDRIPAVRFVQDEARSWIERSDERFDLIQASLIDSWAATSAGAFVLTENSLYTTEAWTEFLNHLTDKGVLTMSRWWVRDKPGEMLRCTDLAYTALRGLGVTQPRRHVMIAVADKGPGYDMVYGVGTIMVSRQPFSDADVRTFRQACDRQKFQVLMDPDQAAYPEFTRLLDPATHDETVAGYPINIEATTDDSPFFFNMLPFSSVFSMEDHGQWSNDFNMKAIVLLVGLFVMVLLLSLVGLLLPLRLHERKARGADGGAGPSVKAYSLYFAAIGLGFILVEISQIQRLTLFLGHPVYSLTVVLFSLLLATGIGAWATGRWLLGTGAPRHPVAALVTIFAVALLAALGLPGLLGLLHGQPMGARIAVSIGVLFLLGIPLGSAFPIGLRLADGKVRHATPWLWAINGALSVVGSVLAVMLSIRYGITFTGLAGTACYGVALFALAWIGRESRILSGAPVS